MKDAELREMFARLESKVEASRPVSAEASVSIIEKIWRDAVNKQLVEPRPLVLPSPRVPMFIGILIGALIFAAGMFAGSFLK